MKLIDRITLVLKSEPQWFEKEASGIKNHTERIIKKSEITPEFLDWVNGIGEGRLVQIVNTENEHVHFTREVKDYSILWEMLGAYIVSISWEP